LAQLPRCRLCVDIAPASSQEHDGSGQHPGEHSYAGPKADDVLRKSKKVNGNAADQLGSTHESSGPTEPTCQDAARDDGTAAKRECDPQIYRSQSAETLFDTIAARSVRL
jgi:hypothetical protein